MSEEVKKISFGFSKLVKPKVSIISKNKEDKKDESVQFIDCVEDKSIKVKNEEPNKPNFLVIPLPKQSSASVKKSDLMNKILNSSVSDINNKTEEEAKTSIPPVSIPIVNNKAQSLDEVAAREIIEDLKKVKNESEELNNFSVPLTTNAPLGEKEPTLDDYDAIPVDKFGIAMLRGMGWAPGKGIGKNEKVVDAKQPVLRPKGLGLGADKVILKETAGAVSEPIKLVKGSFVRIIAGAHKDLFGQVIGFDDETGRLIVKMALGGSTVTFNEFMVQPVLKEEFNKNCRVINVKKFEEYKSKEDAHGVIEKQLQIDSHNSSNQCISQRKESKQKSSRHRDSSVSSNDSNKAQRNKKSHRKSHKSKDLYHSSSENSDAEKLTERKSKHKNYKSHSRVSPEVYKKKYDKYTAHKKGKYRDPSVSSNDSIKEKKVKKTHKKHKRSKGYHSSSSESSDDAEFMEKKSSKYRSNRDNSPEEHRSHKNHDKYRVLKEPSKTKYDVHDRSTSKHYHR